MATNALSAPGKKSMRRSLLFAGVFGVLSALLVLMYLNKVKQGESKGQVAMVPVLVARVDIRERTPITDAMVEIRQVPADARLNAAVSEKNRAVGLIARVPMVAGEQILTNKIADQVRDVGFSAQVPEGKRGVAISVSEVIASGGHISPGDNVDVIGVFEVWTPKDDKGVPGAAGKDQGDKPKVFTSVTILQNVQVLAVAANSDSTLQPDKKGVTPSNKSGEAKSVTLALTPEQAQKIFMSEEIGTLRLSLRPFGDNEQRKVTPATNQLGDLAGG